MPKYFKRKKTYRKKKIYRKKRTASIRRTLAPTSINCVRCVNHVISMNTLLNANGYGYYTPTFTANPSVGNHSIHEWANFATLFRGFRIAGVRTEIVMASSQAWGTTPGAIRLPQVELRILSGRTAPVSQIPTTLDEALQIKQCKSYFLRTNRQRPFKAWSPAYIREVYKSPTPADTTTGPVQRSKFLGTVNGQNVVHSTNTFIFQMSDFTQPALDAVQCQLRFYIYFQMKGQTF